MKYSCMIIVLLLSFLISGTSQAANWVFVIASEKQDVYYYIDASDIEIKNDTVIFWTKSENIEPFKYAGVKTLTGKVEYQIKKNLYRVSQRVMYYEKGDSANNFQVDEWKQLPPIAPITILTAASICTILENKEWISGEDDIAFWQPVWSNNEVSFWWKFNHKGETTFSFFSYRPSTHEEKSYILVGTNTGNDILKYTLVPLGYDSYRSLNPKSPIARLTTQAMNFLQRQK